MRSLHSKLFWRYAILILSLSVVFMLVLYRVWGNELQSNAQSELQADCDNISTILDTQMERVDQLSKRIVDSRQIRSLFIKDNYSDSAEAYYHKRDFSETLFEILRLSFDYLELNMFDVSGRYVHVGDNSHFRMIEPQTVAALPWQQMVINAYGKKIILPAGTLSLNKREEPAISLCRAFAPVNPTKETAILELQMDYGYLSRKITDSIHNQKDKKRIFVYNAAGERIYPIKEDLSPKTHDFIQAFLSEASLDETLHKTINEKGETVLFVSKTSPFTEWTVLVAESEKDLFSAFFEFQHLIIFIFLFVLLVLMLLTNRIAAGLATPIQKLEQHVCSLELEHLDEFRLPNYQNQYRELDSLYRSFGQMKTNLQNSLQSTIEAQTQAVNAKMLALQSQMNPHFIYNTLSSISVLAEDGENEKAVKMCEDLSMLLRYIASGTQAMVSMKQEMEHTVSYMNLIKVKYEERIQFLMDIPQELWEMKIPRLTIQPLVENCVKYGLDVLPPWVIRVQGKIQDDRWYICVRDNGTGFSEEYLKHFYEDTQKISCAPKGKRYIPELEVNGMGILNLYLRLWLLFGQDMLFEISNPSDRGAQIMIGGPIREKQKN